MNVLVLNGSPKGAESNTYRITDAFLRGIKAGGVNGYPDILSPGLVDLILPESRF